MILFFFFFFPVNLNIDILHLKTFKIDDITINATKVLELQNKESKKQSSNLKKNTSAMNIHDQIMEQNKHHRWINQTGDLKNEIS